MERATSKRSRLRALIAAIAGLATAGSPLPVLAHGPDPSGGVVARLDPLAPELAGVRVEVHETIAYQLVVENTTGRLLEVLDERGVPFVRIGPAGVEGNVTAPAWYRSQSPEGRAPKGLLEAARGEKPPAPHWVLARREPNWGWYDARLAGDAHAEQRWQIPLRVDGAPSALRGHFARLPKPTGAVRARLESAGALGPGVRISLLGGPAGAFFLENDSPDVVTVLGRDGEPFVRVGPNGVEANLHSATFAEVARLRGGTGLLLAPNAEAPARWERVATEPRYAWVDLRTAFTGDVPEAVTRRGKLAVLVRWAIPVQIGGKDGATTVRLEGVTEWKPLARPEGKGT